MKTYKKKTYCKNLYKKTRKHSGGSDQNKEIVDNAGDNVQKVATKLNETVSKISNNITTKEGVEYFFKLLETNINNQGNQTKNTLNYFNNSLVDNSINIIKFITNQIKQQIEKVIEQMEIGKGKINTNMNQYTKNFNEKIEEYTNKLINTINTTKKYVDDVETKTTEITQTTKQNGNKKKKTIKKK